MELQAPGGETRKLVDVIRKMEQRAAWTGLVTGEGDWNHAAVINCSFQ